MNTAISVEHLGIAAYQHAAESGLLTPRIRSLALVFQGHHRQHRDAFSTAVQRIGGAPAQPRPIAEYVQSLGAPTTQVQILRLALGLEKRAANAYLFMHRLIDDRELKYLLARFAGDEAMHWGMWAFELGEAAPERAAVFG
jgi:rubrerythrin